MRKLFKNILVCATAAVLAAGSATLAACGTKFTPLEGDYTSTEAAESNGGFAVEYGKYVYFINGATTYESDNTYGKPVKGALMRITKENFTKQTGEAEIVIPSLFVSGDYTAGFFIYNDRVYYATPNNVKSMSGEIEKDWIEFKSAKLDGSDIVSYFRLSDNATAYRFVQTEKNGDVYLLYNGKKPNDNDGTSGIQSYNTATKTCTTIAQGASSYVFNSLDKTDPYVYFTMGVTDLIDSDAPLRLSYNQIYRACADVTEAPADYDYDWDQDYLDENDGVEPYVNLGTIVLDGIGKPTTDEDVTRFTHDYKDAQGKVIAEPLAPFGYTYTLQSYTNGGLYFTRDEVLNNGSPGGGAMLYYLSASDYEKQGWNSISGNLDRLSNAEGKLDVVAKSTDTDKATTSAIFYIEEEGDYKHHYIYVSGANMIRIDVNKTTASITDEVICKEASGASLVRIDNRATSDEPYNYVWFTRSNGSGMSIERAVYNGKSENYEDLDIPGRNNKPYKALKLLNLQHKSGWYPFEIIDDILIYADAEAVGGISYDYLSTVSLTDKEGKYLNNQVFEEEVNDKWNALMDSDGYLQSLSSSELSTALTYYFRTGKTDAFYDNIQEAIDLGKKETYLYTEEDQTAFKAFTENDTILTKKTDGTEVEAEDQFKDEDGNFYRTRSYFIKSLSVVADEDQEAMDEYWSGYLKRYIPSEEEKNGMEDWELALAIVLPVAAVAAATAATVTVLLKKKRAATAAQRPERMRVETNIDKNVDVYGMRDENGNDEE